MFLSHDFTAESPWAALDQAPGAFAVDKALGVNSRHLRQPGADSADPFQGLLGARPPCPPGVQGDPGRRGGARPTCPSQPDDRLCSGDGDHGAQLLSSPLVSPRGGWTLTGNRGATEWTHVPGCPPAPGSSLLKTRAQSPLTADARASDLVSTVFSISSPPRQPTLTRRPVVGAEGLRSSSGGVWSVP